MVEDAGPALVLGKLTVLLVEQAGHLVLVDGVHVHSAVLDEGEDDQIGRASCRERV